MITTDGYNLTLHRIPYSRHDDLSALTRKPAVLVQHGILCSSTDWVIAGPNSSLGEYFTEIEDLSAYAVRLYLGPGGSPRARVL